MQSLPDISKPRAGDDWDEFAAQRTAKHYADKAAKMEADLAATRGRGGPESGLAATTGSTGGGGGSGKSFKSPYELVQMERKRGPAGPPAPVPAFAHVSGGML